MKMIPDKIDGMNVLSFVRIDKQRQQAEDASSSRHVIKQEPAQTLVVAHDPSGCGFYLFECGANWNVLADTWYEYLDAAKDQPDIESSMMSSGWIDKNGSKYRLHSRTLAGLEGAECWGPRCNEKVLSTGWLDLDTATTPSWHLEFVCPVHGIMQTYVSSLSALVLRVSTESGIGIIAI